MTGVSWLISPAYVSFRSAFLATLRQLALGCPPLVRTDSLYSAKGGRFEKTRNFSFCCGGNSRIGSGQRLEARSGHRYVANNGDQPNDASA